MTEPTDEMIAAFQHAEDSPGITCGDTRAGLAAVLAIVERERQHPTNVRERLDAVLAEALPVSGGRVRTALIHLRWALAELDKERAANVERRAQIRGRQ